MAASLGASHQTGWTGVLAWMMRVYGTITDFEAVVDDVAGLPKEGQSESDSGQAS